MASFPIFNIQRETIDVSMSTEVKEKSHEFFVKPTRPYTVPKVKEKSHTPSPVRAETVQHNVPPHTLSRGKNVRKTVQNDTVRNQQQSTSSSENDAVSVTTEQLEFHNDGGSHSEDDDGQENCSQSHLGTAGNDDIDSEILMDLLPTGGDSGIFEILMPNGEKMAVVADISNTLASFLLTPSSDRLRNLLQRKRMELERGLVQRMSRHVRLTVL